MSEESFYEKKYSGSHRPKQNKHYIFSDDEDKKTKISRRHKRSSRRTNRNKSSNRNRSSNKKKSSRKSTQSFSSKSKRAKDCLNRKRDGEPLDWYPVQNQGHGRCRKPHSKRNLPLVRPRNKFREHKVRQILSSSQESTKNRRKRLCLKRKDEGEPLNWYPFQRSNLGRCRAEYSQRNQKVSNDLRGYREFDSFDLSRSERSAKKRRQKECDKQRRKGKNVNWYPNQKRGKGRCRPPYSETSNSR